MMPLFLKRYLLAVSRYSWVLPVGLALGLGAGGFVATQPEPTPIHRIQATLVTNYPATAFSATGTEIRQPIATYTTDALLPDQLLQTTARSVGLDPAIMAKNLKVILPSEDERSGTGAKPQEPNITQIRVEYQDINLQRAQQVIEQLLKGAIQHSQESNSDRLRQVMASLQGRLPQIKQELTSAEQQLEAYDRQEGLALLAAQNGSLVSHIQQSASQKQQMRLDMAGVQVELASLQQKLGLSPEQAYVSSALSADPILADLRAKLYQTESQLAIARQNFRPEHPTMVSLVQQKQAYEAQLRHRAQEVMGGGGVSAPLAGATVRRGSNLDPERQRLALRLVELTTTQKRLQQQYNALLRFEQQARQQLTQLPNKQLERTRLEDQLKLKKALHDQMQAKLVDARAAEAETVSSLSVAQVVQLPLSPQMPKSVPMLIALGGLVGMVFGAGLIFCFDTLDSTLYTPEDLREALKQEELPLLGLLPFVSGEQTDPVPLLLDGDSPYLDYYERLCSHLQVLEGGPARVILVGSLLPGEGKSVTAYNLAIAAAKTGQRTLLIEANLRVPSLARYVGVEPDSGSPLEPLLYYGQINECVRLAPWIENLYMVPGTGPQREAAAILQSSEFQQLLEDARGRFDWVIVDVPSLGQSHDALLIAPHADGLVLVTRPGFVRKSLLTEVLADLEHSPQVSVLGAVINAVDLPEVIVPQQHYQSPQHGATRESIASGLQG
jgi:capsular exopolysaccharide synthesis family protein